MSDATTPRRSVRLSSEEAWEFVGASHTAVFGTLRSDGMAIMLPVWFVVIDQKIYIRTGASSKKALRVRRDSRASFLVESGEHWEELKAVHMVGHVAEVAPESERGIEAENRLLEKYATFRTESSRMSPATRSVYATERVFIEFEPENRILSWDNRRLGL